MAKGDFLENIEDTVARARLGSLKPAPAQTGFFMALREGHSNEYADTATCASTAAEARRLAKRARGKGRVTRIVEYKAYLVREVK